MRPKDDSLVVVSPRLKTLLKDIGISWEGDQIYSLLSPSSDNMEYPKKDLEVISDAADFFFRTTNGEIAFPLYLTLWLTGWQPEGKRKRDFLLACAAAASTQSDRKIVLELLKTRISGEEKAPSELYERLLLHSSLFVINLNMGAAAGEQNVPQLFDHLDVFMGEYRRRKIELDIPGYILISQLLQLSTQGAKYGIKQLEPMTNRDLESFESGFIKQMPGPFILRDGKMKNTCLRCCLDWCLERLRATFQLPNDWDILRQKSIDKGWSDFIAVFWFLWIQWHQSQNEDMSQASWQEDKEMVMGLSTTELLGDMSSLILSATPKRLRAGPRLDADADFQQRIVQGAEALLALPDRELVITFLRYCFEGDGWVYPTEGKNHSEILIATNRIFLSGRISASGGHLSDQFTTRRTGGLDEAIAPSYSTSTLSSMARRAAGHWRKLTHTLSGRWLKRGLQVDAKGLAGEVSALTLNDKNITKGEVRTKHWTEALREESEDEMALVDIYG